MFPISQSVLVHIANRFVIKNGDKPIRNKVVDPGKVGLMLFALIREARRRTFEPTWVCNITRHVRAHILNFKSNSISHAIDNTRAAKSINDQRN